MGAQANGAQAVQQAAAAQVDTGRFDAAHRALVADPSMQFELTRPAPPAPTPAWLTALGDWIAWALSPIGRALAWIGSLMPDAPYARIVLWTVIALLALGVVWMAVERIRYGRWAWPRWRRRRLARDGGADGADGADEPLFATAPVRAWLREADALAEAGRFAEAVHLLLFRSVEDLGRRRPGAVQPASTTRELAAAPVLPPSARQRFAAIAGHVERSLFGGRPVDADDWQRARADYTAFALPGSWRA